MPIPADLAADVEMNCLEVRGGSGASNHCWRRPGLDLWIQSGGPELGEAGGDLHLLSSCASGRITRMLLADVCGMGAFFSDLGGMLRDLLSRNINSMQQCRLIAEISARLQVASHEGGFASLLVSTYFAPTRSFNLCNIGHPPPLIFRAADHCWQLLKQTVEPHREGIGASLCDGVVHPDEYHQSTTKLELGDMVLSYSSQLIECRDREGQILGCSGLLERVRKLDTQRPGKLIPILLQQLHAEHSTNTACDNATILLCRGTNTKVSWQDNVLAPFRLWRRATDHTRI